MKTLYVGLLTIVMTVPVALFTKSDSANVNFDKPMIVAGHKVPAGNYDVKWTGNRPAVQVQFLRNKKVVATAPAKVIDKKNLYNNAVESQTENGSRVLTAIDRSNLTLKFTQNIAATQSGGQ
jgi:hypothetical protein